MIRKLLFLLILMFAGAAQLNAQVQTKQVANCHKIEIEDRDRRSFDDRSPILMDVDGDGKPDSIIPRIYAVKASRKVSGKAKPKAKETHWISFDLKTSRGRVLRSFFKYPYGTEEADYWVYALVPCKVNKDGRTDLVFYSGDDASEETVILMNRGNGFRVQSRKVSELE